MKISGPPWPVRVLYRDCTASVYWHGKCGVSAYDEESGHHVWGGRTVWSVLIYLGMEVRAATYRRNNDLAGCGERTV